MITTMIYKNDKLFYLVDCGSDNLECFFLLDFIYEKFSLEMINTCTK